METGKTDSAGKKSAQGKSGGLVEDFIIAVIQSGQFDRVVRAAVPGVLDKWAGKSRKKRLIAKSVAKSLGASFSEENAKQGDAPVLEVLKRDDFPALVSADLPGIINWIFDCAVSLCESINALPAEEKSALVKQLIDNSDLQSAGTIITGIFSFLNDLHRDDPLFFSTVLSAKIRGFIEETDFGEIKEAFDNSSQDIIETAGIFNEEIWRYPAKVICLFSLFPAFVNILAGAAVSTVEPLNKMAPDLLTDVLLSLVSDINGTRAGELVNQVSELVRKLHTGSALLGEQSRPQLPLKLSDIASDMLSSIDTGLLLSAKEKFAEIREMCMASFLDVLKGSPELFREYTRKRFSSASSNLKRFSDRLHLFETEFSDSELADEFARGIEAMDPQEAAHAVSRALSLLNRIEQERPGIIGDALLRFFTSIDEYEAGEAVRLFAEALVESIKPLASDILPPVINGIAALIEEGKENGGEEFEDALSRLGRAINGGGTS